MAQNTIFCIDNSSNSFNGDFSPSRLRVQQEIVYEIAQLRLQSNHESLVAVVSMANKRPEVVVALSRNSSQLNRRLFAIQSSGTVNPLTTIRIAQLMHAAKRRRNPRLTLRLMLFICSISSLGIEDPTRFLKMADQLRKDQVMVEVIAFGLLAETHEIGGLFQPFIDALGTGSQFLKINRGFDFFTIVFNQLNSLRGHGRLNIPGLTGPDNDEADDELMLAIAISLQEANQRAKEAKEHNVTATTNSAEPVTVKVPEKMALSVLNPSPKLTSSNTPPSSPVKFAIAPQEKVTSPSKNRPPGKSADIDSQVNAKIFKAAGATGLEPRRSPVKAFKAKVLKEVRLQSRGSVKAKTTPVTSPNANLRLAETDHGKRRVKRVNKQEFYSIVTPKNAKTTVEKSTKVTKKTAGAKFVKTRPNVVTIKTIIKNNYKHSPPQLPARVPSQTEAPTRKMSGLHNNSKLDTTTSFSNLISEKLDSRIYRNPQLFPRLPSKSTTKMLFTEKQPKYRSSKPAVDKNTIQEMINAKMRLINIASSSKVALHNKVDARPRSPCSLASKGKRASSPASVIFKMNPGKPLVTVKQGTRGGPAATCKPPTNDAKTKKNKKATGESNQESADKSNNQTGQQKEKSNDKKQCQEK